MDLRQLKYFIAVAEEQHFGHAAARVGIEQSPLSKAIKDLEQLLGVKLFTRTTRAVQLTPAGELLRDDGRRILASLQRTECSLKALTAGRTQRLRIGIADGLFHPKLTRLLHTWRTANLQCDVQVTVLSKSDLADGSLDIGFGFDTEAKGDQISETLWQERLVVALAASHPLASRQRVSLEELDEEPLSAHSASPVPLNLFTTLVGAQLRVGTMTEGQAAILSSDDIIIRQLAKPIPIGICLLRRHGDCRDVVSRFIDVARQHR